MAVYIALIVGQGGLKIGINIHIGYKLIFKPLQRFSDSKAENRILHLHTFGFQILPRFFEGQKMMIIREKVGPFSKVTGT